jgi:hypothetical protein
MVGYVSRLVSCLYLNYLSHRLFKGKKISENEEVVSFCSEKVVFFEPICVTF